LVKPVSYDKTQQHPLFDHNPILIIEFDSSAALDNALTEKGIILSQKTRNQYRTMACRIKEDFDPISARMEDYIRKNSASFMMDAENKDNTPAFTILSDIEKRIRNKIEQTGTLLVNWDIRMNLGVKTGYDEAFMIDEKMKDDFILADYKNIDIIKPLLMEAQIQRYEPKKTNQWLICIPWHFPLLYDKTIQSASNRAEERFRQQYPIIYTHLEKYKGQLIARNMREVGVVFEWYALQRFGISNEWDDFTHPKIVWKRESTTSMFCMDYSGCAVMDTMCYITGQHLKYLLGVLNSKLGSFILRDSPRLSNGEIQLNIAMLETVKIPVPNSKIESEMISLVNKRTSDMYHIDYDELDDKINQHVYEIYGLDEEEREYIESNG
jgi:hypothetical protein